MSFSGDKIHSSDEKKPEKSVLYAMQALAQPISQRFRYHFEGTRETNRLDKVSYSKPLLPFGTDGHVHSRNGTSHTS